jgi:hypothetical protein
MLTRDPLAVPYRHERYWMTRGRPDERALERFASDVLAKAWERLPGVTGLAPAAALAAEDENVRRSVRYARDELGL